MGQVDELMMKGAAAAKAEALAGTLK